MIRPSEKGFTLIELIAASMLLAIVVIVMWNTFINSINTVRSASEIRIVTYDAQKVLERIQSINYANIVNEYPNDSNVPGDDIGGFFLDGEYIKVSYPSGITADPLEIEVEIGWTSHTGKEKSEIFKTLRSSI